MQLCITLLGVVLMRRHLDPDWLKFDASAAPPAAKVPESQSFATTIAEQPISNAMESTAAETKVQIRLSTRDAGLQIAEEPTVLLVQTCKSTSHTRSALESTEKGAYILLEASICYTLLRR